MYNSANTRNATCHHNTAFNVTFAVIPAFALPSLIACTIAISTFTGRLRHLHS
jgi:hypothetical protein